MTLGGFTVAALASLALSGSIPAAQADFDDLRIEEGAGFSQ